MKNDNSINRKKNKYLLALLLLFTHIAGSNARCDTDSITFALQSDTLPLPRSLVVESLRLDTTFTGRVYRESMKQKPTKVNIYDTPYSISANYPNYKRLGINSGVLFGGGLMALGVLQLLPEESTAWNKKEITEVPLFKRWKNNVKAGPVWDGDKFIFNYVLHPYGGAAYYMSARSQGFNLYYSMLYCFGISSIFWEYGIEAFMEVPSIQDMFITPLAGTLLGESFYLLKRHIVSNNYKLFGSGFLGNVVAYIIDPVNEVIGIFAGNPCRSKKKPANTSLVCMPQFNTAINGSTFGFMVNLSF